MPDAAFSQCPILGFMHFLLYINELPDDNRAFDFWQQLEWAFTCETLWTGLSNNSGASDVRIDKSVLDEKSSSAV